MFKFFEAQKLKSFFLSAYTLFFVSALITWPLFAEWELFELLHDATRAYEDYDLDEAVLLVFNLMIALILSLIYRSNDLRRLSRAKEQERQRADRNANHDALTGLMNRRAFNRKMEVALSAFAKENDGRCVAMVDLDRFKPVNDLRGHAVGDAVLVAIASRLRDIVGDLGDVARLGGDEFAVLFKSALPVHDVERTVRRLVHLTASPIKVDSRGVSVSCSVGLVLWNHDISATEAMRRADAALYKAKSEGRAQFAWYDADLDQQSTQRAALEIALRDAIPNDEVQAWFQPIVDMSTEQVVGFEVLARWTHPEFGSVQPEDFIEISEDCGLIDALGQSVMRQALKAARDWPEDLSISVNVSPIQFSNPEFADTMKDLFAKSGFDARRLTIEVTESSFIADFDSAREKLNALKDLGVSVALDDFGTGYSSLASLRNLPFDRIKIDRSFVTGIDKLPANQKIVKIIMDLADGFGLDVTIEGIETTEEQSFLGAGAGGYGQGFLFGKPLPPKDIEWLIETKWTKEPTSRALPPGTGDGRTATG